MSDPTLPPPAGTGQGVPWKDASAPGWRRLAPIREEAIRAQVRVDKGRRILRMIALAAAIICLVAVVTTATTQWHVLSEQGSQGVSLGQGLASQNPSVDGWQVLQVIAVSLSAGWGYALAGVAAFGASLWFDDSRARDLFELLDDDDGEDEEGGDLDGLPPPSPTGPVTRPN